MNSRFRQFVVAAVALVVVGSLTVTEASAQWRWRRRAAYNNYVNYGYGGGYYGGGYSGGYGMSYSQPMHGYTVVGNASGGCNPGTTTTQVYGETHSVTGAESRTVEAPGVQPQPNPTVIPTQPTPAQPNPPDVNQLNQNPNNSILPRDPNSRDFIPPVPTDTSNPR